MAVEPEVMSRPGQPRTGEEEGRTVRRLLKALVGVAVVVALVAVMMSLFAPTQAASGPACLCPDIYKPVICSNGRTYPNLCVAKCNKAKNCVPTGEI